ncbi:MAG: amidohydrolase family protein [Longimicrobiales bacterium]
MTPERIIDFHTHPYRPRDLSAGTRDFVFRVSAAVAEHGARLADPSYFAGVLRAQGVDRAVLLAEHCPATSGNVRTETVLALARAEPEFFLPFASVDPVSEANAADQLRDYIARGARGLKLYPSYQFFYPNERRAYVLYEICQAAGIPVLMHIGSSVLPGTRLKYCDPIYLDDVAVDFPELVLVMAHGGRGFWYDACAFLAAHHGNVYIDIAGLVPARLREHYPRLERLADKIVFGSDWPAMPKSVAANAAALARLGLGDAALRAILRGNAARILGIAGEP